MTAPSDPILRALDQYGGQLHDLPGVQGVGADSAGLVVYVEDADVVGDSIPSEVTVCDEHGVETVVAVRVEAIGTITPE